MSDEVRVTVRTADTGHTTLSLPLDDLPGFVDARLAEGKNVVAESGMESLAIWSGRDLLDFFLRRRKKTAAEDTVAPKEEVTVLNRMAGGSDADDIPVELTTQVLAAAVQYGRGDSSRNEAPMYPPASTYPPPMPLEQLAYGLHASRLDPVAEVRAWQALREREGEGPALALAAGGAVVVRSHLWPSVVYLVRLGTIQVLREGQTVATLCLQLADGGPIWDAVANRLSLLRAGEEGEIQVWATATAR